MRHSFRVFPSAGYFLSEWEPRRSRTIVLLLHNQFHQAIFHDRLIGAADILILRGRIGFIDSDNHSTGPTPLGNYFAVLGGSNRRADGMLRAFDCNHLPRSLRTSLNDEIRRGSDSRSQTAAHEEMAEALCTPNRVFTAEKRSYISMLYW